MFSFTVPTSRRSSLVIIMLLTCVAAPPTLPILQAQGQSEKIVYVVICVDSEMLLGHEPFLGSSDVNPILDISEYSRESPSTVAAVFEGGFRSSHTDPYGSAFKLTWFAEMDYLFAQGNYIWGDDSPANVSGYTAVYDTLMSIWGTEIQLYGDSLEYHHHFEIYDGTWKRYDDGPDEEYPGYHMYALDHMIIDRRFYPSCWRTGWLLMPSALSNWLEQWIPFDYTPSSYYPPEEVWYPRHPSGMNRWETTCSLTGAGPSSDDIADSFARARDYGSAIYSFYCHDGENMVDYVDPLQSYLDNADQDEVTYPGVSFKYVSAREAMQKALGFVDFSAPVFTITRSSGTYTITSSEPLWMNHPYVAMKYSDGTYMHPTSTLVGDNTWRVTAPTEISSEENFAIRARSTLIPVATVTASNYLEGYEPQEAIDGSTNTYWDSYPETPPQWLKLDFGENRTLSSVRTHFWNDDGRQYGYYLETSDDGLTWIQVTTEKYVSGVTTDNFGPAISTRYIRLQVTDCIDYTYNEDVHVREMEVWTESGATAKSYDGNHVPDLAIDGIEATDHSNYWGTNASTPEGQLPQWLELDLRSSVSVNKIITHFYDSDDRTCTYYVEASNDTLTWITIVPSKTGSGSVTDTFGEVNTRYVRITITGNTGSNAAQIEEIEVCQHVTNAPLPPLQLIGIAASDLYGNPGVLVVNDQSARIESCSSDGYEKDIFNLDDAVYVSGNGFSPVTDYSVYVIQNRTWLEGMHIAPFLATQTYHTDSAGRISSENPIWAPNLTAGYYDVVVDANGNGEYESAYDFLDHLDVEGAGFFVSAREDINADRKVDCLDLFTLGIAFGSILEGPNWNRACDLNEDDRVDDSDLSMLSLSYGKTWNS